MLQVVGSTSARLDFIALEIKDHQTMANLSLLSQEHTLHKAVFQRPLNAIQAHILVDQVLDHAKFVLMALCAEKQEIEILKYALKVPIDKLLNLLSVYSVHLVLMLLREVILVLVCVCLANLVEFARSMV